MKEWTIPDTETEGKTITSTISKEEIKVKLEEVLALIDDFEEEKAIVILKELLDNTLEEKASELIKDALTALEKDYDADKAAELIGGIY